MKWPLLFNIALIDLLLERENDNITSYADDTTPYSWEQDKLSVTTLMTPLPVSVHKINHL